MFTYELCLSLRLVRDGVANHPGVGEGEGGDQSLGQAGGERGGLSLGNWSGGGEKSQEEQVGETGAESHDGCEAVLELTEIWRTFI